MERFIDDDPGYFGWLRAHPDGFVVNTYRKPTTSYMMLHRASCDHIADSTVENYTKDYIKICSERRSELTRWAQEQLKGELTNCFSCSPGH